MSDLSQALPEVEGSGAVASQQTAAVLTSLQRPLKYLPVMKDRFRLAEIRDEDLQELTNTKKLWEQNPLCSLLTARRTRVVLLLAAAAAREALPNWKKRTGSLEWSLAK